MGRIGRSLFRLALYEPDLIITDINDIIEPKQLFYLLKYDSIHGELKDLEFNANS